MKKTFLFYILACMTSLFIFTSCEENTDQVIKAQPDTIKEITNRTIEDCDECPFDYCCCFIEMTGTTTSADLRFCGVYNASAGTPCGTFNPGSPCSSFSGATVTLNLTSINPRELFCVSPGGSFRILNNTGVAVTFRFTCQHDEVDPDMQNITLGIGEDRFFYNNGACVLSECQ